jgi:hypothetical protein
MQKFACGYEWNGKFHFPWRHFISIYIAITLYLIHFKLMQQAKHMFNEIDYVREGRNVERFASLYYLSSSKFNFCGKISICFFLWLFGVRLECCYFVVQKLSVMLFT